MATCTVKNWEGGDLAPVELNLAVAKESAAEHILWLAVKRQLHNSRQGTSSTLTKSEVRGGGKKPWKQKGTGRARAGSSRSPLWRGGGVIFGPKPREFDIKMNRKERRLALRTALQSRADDLLVVEEFESNLATPKTKEFVQALKRWGVDAEEKILLILDQKQENTYRSARNVARVRVITANNLNVFDLLHADRIVMTTTALDVVKATYQDDTKG
jgi:large subunit ribosomal protein L4